MELDQYIDKNVEIEKYSQQKIVIDWDMTLLLILKR